MGKAKLFIGTVLKYQRMIIYFLFLGSFRRNVDEEELLSFIESIVPGSEPDISLGFNRAGTTRISFVTISDRFLHAYLKKDGMNTQYGRLRINLKY